MSKQGWPCVECAHYHDGQTTVEMLVRTKQGAPELYTNAPMWRDGKGQWTLAGCESGCYPNCKGSSESRHKALTPGCDGQMPEGWEPRI